MTIHKRSMIMANDIYELKESEGIYDESPVIR
jgi:hypothetical protein